MYNINHMPGFEPEMLRPQPGVKPLSYLSAGRREGGCGAARFLEERILDKLSFEPEGRNNKVFYYKKQISKTKKNCNQLKNYNAFAKFVQYFSNMVKTKKQKMESNIFNVRLFIVYLCSYVDNTLTVI